MTAALLTDSPSPRLRKLRVPSHVQFTVGVYGGVAILNLIALEAGRHLEQFLASAILLIAAQPMRTYLRRGEAGLPLVPFFCALYGIHFGLYVLLPLEPEILFQSLPRASYEKALIVALGGLLVFLVSFRFWPSSMWRRVVPGIPGTVAPASASIVGAVLATGGLLTGIAITQSLVPVADRFESLWDFVALIGLAGTALLMIRYLRGELRFGYKLYLALIVAPLYFLHVTSLSGGGPAAATFVTILMVYVGERRRFPWVMMVAGALVVILLVASRGDIRQVHDQRAPLLERFEVNVEITSIRLMRPDQLLEGLETTLRRMDYLQLLAFVVHKTPGEVPYWNGETYGGLVWKWIPRVIYPDKPVEDQGLQFPRRYAILDEEHLDKGTVTLPFLVEFYANRGTGLVLAGMFGVGLIFQLLYRLGNLPNSSHWGRVAIAAFGSGILWNIGSSFTSTYGGLLLHGIAFGIIGWRLGGQNLEVTPQSPRAPRSVAERPMQPR